MTTNTDPLLQNGSWDGKDPVGDGYVIELARSGKIDFGPDMGSGEDWSFLVMPVLWLGSWLVHLLVFWGGWTVFVWRDDEPVLKKRYRSRRRAAQAAESLVATITTAGLPR